MMERAHSFGILPSMGFTSATMLEQIHSSSPSLSLDQTMVSALEPQQSHPFNPNQTTKATWQSMQEQTHSPGLNQMMGATSELEQALSINLLHSTIPSTSAGSLEYHGAHPFSS